MIIEIPDDNSIIKWKKNDNEDWKSAEISDLIKAYEERLKSSTECYDWKRSYPDITERNYYNWRGKQE